MKNIMQYTEGRSALHELHPNLKITLLVLITAALFLFTNPLTFLFGFLAILAVSLSAHYNPLTSLRQLKFLLVFFIVLPFFHSAIFPGTAFLTLFSINFSFEGLVFGAIVVMRLLILFTTFTLFSRTTSPKKLTQALTQSKVKLVRKVGFIISFTLNLMPVIFRDINRIKDAQTSRGADFDQRNLGFFAKIKNTKRLFADYLSLLIPLLVVSLNRAEKQTIAIECRGFNLENRTFLYELRVRGRDMTIFTFYFSLIILLILLDKGVFAKLL